MHRAISIPVLGFLFCLPSWATESLPRSGPEAEGVSSRKLQEFVETRDREGDGVHSVMVIRHGKVIAEGWWTPYTAESNHVLYSLSKSFTSTAIGFAVAEGKVDICRFPPFSSLGPPQSAHPKRQISRKDQVTDFSPRLRDPLQERLPFIAFPQ